MAETIVDYLWREQHTFAEMPLGPVDSLAFSALSYLQYDLQGLSLLGDAHVLLHDVVALGDWKRLCSRSWMASSELAEPFMRAVMGSRRLRDVRVSFFHEEFSQVAGKQFTAMTFTYPTADGMQAYLAFRGTDGTVAGWHEDFNMSFMQVVPSHATALGYVSGVASAFAGTLVLGGHSKGGNLAEYATLSCDESVYRRIVGVYNYDGPAFEEDPSPRVGDERYRAMHQKFVPESSVIGMIMETGDDYTVVRSMASGLRQHDPLTWLTEGGGFATKDQLNQGAQFFNHAFSSWAQSCSVEERRRYVSTVFRVLESTDAVRFEQIKDNPLPMLLKAVTESVTIDEADRRFVLDTTKSLADLVRAQVKDSVSAQRQYLSPLKLAEQIGQIALPPFRDSRKPPQDDEN